MLHIGDKVVYPMHGAGEIAGIEECEVLGEDKSYYVLRMPIGNMKVMIPTEKADSIGLRDVISQDTVEEIEEILKGSPEKVGGSWNKRFHAILSRMKSGDICEVAAGTEKSDIAGSAKEDIQRRKAAFRSGAPDRYQRTRVCT